MRAYLFHGSGETGESFWLPWLSRELSAVGYAVHAPHLPESNTPDLQQWLAVVHKLPIDDSTILVGHSSGATLILSLLERLDYSIKKAILVAGYARQIGQEAPPLLQKSYDWQKISTNAREFIFVNSDNDPWGCTDTEGRFMLEQIGHGTLVIPKGEGHMGSGSFKQPYLEFPLLKALVLA